jgi:hypothetical protein
VRRLLLLGVSLAISLLLAEAVLSLRVPETATIEDACRWVEAPEDCSAARRAGVAFDTRSVAEVIEALSRRGIEAWPAIVPKHTAGFRTGEASDAIQHVAGIANVTTVYCNNGEHVLYRADEHGFRNPAGLHAANTAEIAVIGDSFAQGYCVPSDHDIAARLRRAVPGTVNLGVDDAGPLFELAALREYAEPLRPRVVLWLYFEGNDLEDLEWEKRQPVVPRYLEPDFGQGLRERQPAIDRRLKQIATALRRVWEQERRAAQAEGPRARPGWRRWAAFATLPQLRQRIERMRLERAPFDEALFRAILARARERVSAWGGRLYLVYLPAWERFGDPGAASPHRDGVLRSAKELGIGSLDVSEVFAAQGDPTSLFPLGAPGHYTASGYALVGDAILSFLRTGNAHSPRRRRRGTRPRSRSGRRAARIRGNGRAAAGAEARTRSRRASPRRD